MSSSEDNHSRGKEVVKAYLSVGSALLVAIIAAIGGTIGSYLTGSMLVESTTVPALIKARTDCINTINENEQRFREKASNFLAAVAAFDADKLLIYQSNNNELYEPAKLAITQAMSISPYSSERLALLAINIAASIKILAITDVEDDASSEAYKTLSSSMGEWHEAYEEFMKTFDIKRDTCQI